MILPPYVAGYWGKSADDGWHPLAYHALDVAAVGVVLLRSDPGLGARLDRLVPGLAGVVPLWLALHDVGKFAPCFQGKVPQLREKLLGRADRDDWPDRHHADLGFLLWRKGVLPPGGWDGPGWMPLACAMLGHHGVPPPNLSIDGDDVDCTFGDEALKDALAFAADAGALMGNPPVPSLDPKKVRLASWLAAGVAILCDWIGSNRGWFPYHPPTLPLDDYWKIATAQATRAVEAAGMAHAAVAPAGGMTGLFPELGQPTPMQRAVGELTLGKGQAIAVVEDVTGSGKTEAALLLAQRLMAEGAGDGIYVGLPTQATANAMFERMGAFYRRLFRDDGPEPSLVLAHGRSRDHPGFRAIREFNAPPLGETGEKTCDGGADTASAWCAEWIADGRKKALLAEVGVGTLDQALLAILPARHQALRLAGLAGSILIADEVHAYDAYTRGLLERLLELHAALGGSAVVLSATLTRGQRQSLVSAFAEGCRRAGSGDGGAPECRADDFPLLTLWGSGLELPVETAVAARGCKTFSIEGVASVDDAVAKAAALAATGGCVAWIRNTVDDARRAFDLLAAAGIAWDRLYLFHSRFAVADRLAVEREIVALFGKGSTDADRAGRVLVATQVVEQSLDLDFDHMISDLAPVDLLLQRAGRLHRHDRGNDRGAAILRVLAPDPEPAPAADWPRALLPGTAAVYRDHGRLWLSWRVLRDVAADGEIRLPDDARALIEAVYGPNADARIPDALRRSSDQAEGRAQADAYFSVENAVRIDKGYTRDSAIGWGGDVRAPTRLDDDPSVCLRLARRDGNRLAPWAPCDQPEGEAAAWRASEVSVPLRRIGEIPATQRTPDGDAVLVVLDPCPADRDEGQGTNSWTGQIGPPDHPVTVTYHPRRGLELRRGS